ncbi:MAG: D-alanyl-D-alanine carboxypeptidase family protein [Acidimicrobiia bacterium]
MTVDQVQARISEITARLGNLRAPVPAPVMVGRGTGLAEAGSVPEFSNLYAQALTAATVSADATPSTIALSAYDSSALSTSLNSVSSRSLTGLAALGRATSATAVANGMSSATLLKALAGLGPAALTTAASTTATAQGRIGNFGAIAVPQELQGYGNARIPTEVLAPIGIGNYRMWAPAADAFRQMTAAAKADGVTIGARSGYRSWKEQEATVEKNGLYDQGGWAAAPGTSNHGWGLAVDVNVDDQGQAWLRQNGWKFGFVEAVPREPWHWEFRPAQSGVAKASGLVD